MKKVLLTGGSGFIGKNVIEYFKNSSEYKIITPSSRELNCINEEEVKNYLVENQFDIVLNFAVYGNGIDKQKDANKELEYNLRIFLNFEKNQHLYKRMLYTGTGAEYNKQYSICSVKEEEEGIHIPVEPYGLMRYITDRIIRKSTNIYSLKLFAIFGKYEPWYIRFISNCCCKAIKGIPISIRQNVYFDYLYIEDFCKILEWFMNLEHIPNQHAYNVVSGKKIDLYSLAKMVVEISGKNLPIYVCIEGLGKEYTADNTALLNDMGGFEFTQIKKAIELLYQWYEQHEEEIELYHLFYQ